jgi:hypothetical protein
VIRTTFSKPVGNTGKSSVLVMMKQLRDWNPGLSVG